VDVILRTQVTKKSYKTNVVLTCSPRALFYSESCNAKRLARQSQGDSLATDGKLKELTAGIQGLTFAPGRTSFFLLQEIYIFFSQQ